MPEMAATGVATMACGMPLDRGERAPDRGLSSVALRLVALDARASLQSLQQSRTFKTVMDETESNPASCPEARGGTCEPTGQAEDEDGD